ncbi:MAG: hypothetical protein SF123_15050 [Chloroflexota bacterium]|nr:hypothetical protein [Chloroflexota bacterium]
MANLQVLFEVPQTILNGLSTGVLERVGGVIRDATSKEIVTWLRDSDIISGITSLPIPNPVNWVLQAAQAGVTLLDGHVTRDVVYGVGNQVSQVGQQVQNVANQVSVVSGQVAAVSGQVAAVSGQVTGIAGQLGALTALNGFMASGMVLNFAMSGISLFATIKRLDKLSSQIEQLGHVVRSEFNYDRDLSFKVALQAARDIFESGDSKMSDQASRSALDNLYAAREHYMSEYERTLKTRQDANSIQLAQQYLLRALVAEVSRIRCYLATGNVQMTRQRLNEDLSVFRNASTRLVKHWLGSKPSLYFHKDNPGEYLDRFLYVQRWLQSPDDVYAVKPQNALFNVVNEVRKDFWNEAVLVDENENLIGQFIDRVRRGKDQNARVLQVEQIPINLANVEMIIENYQHLIGYDLELRSMRLSLEDWQTCVSKDDLNKHGFAMILDENVYQRLGLSSHRQ